jgi:hypothetical protein
MYLIAVKKNNIKLPPKYKKLLCLAYNALKVKQPKIITVAKKAVTMMLCVEEIFQLDLKTINK